MHLASIRFVIRLNNFQKWALVFFAMILVLYLVLLRGNRFNDPYSAVIYDREGRLLGARVSDDGQWRFPQTGPVPEKVAKSIIAYEDRYFYIHPGFNPVSLVRAAWLNTRARRIVSGGSTISMQTIRLQRKGKPRTIAEKIIELALALRLEWGHSKTEILALYAGHAPYGGNIVGIEAAAWRYFGTSADNLSWSEAAVLAVLPNSPGLVHPGRNRDVLERKRNRVLSRLHKLDWIDDPTYRSALLEPLPAKPHQIPKLAPHLLNLGVLEYPGREVRTTLDGQLQERITEIVNRHSAQLQGNHIYNLCALVIEVETGHILAYVGNSVPVGKEAHGHEIDAILTPRSTGSILKPVLYAGMLDDGKLLPGSLVPDVPMNFSGFAPKNFDGEFRGAVPANLALSRSLNVPAVYMLRQYGTERFLDLLREIGLRTLTENASHYGLSLILGGAECTLFDLTGIYASFSRSLMHFSSSGGYYSNDYRKPVYVQNSSMKQDNPLAAPVHLSAASVWLTYSAMIEVTRPQSEWGWEYFYKPQSIAWKTGTSFGFRDGWAIGTSSSFVVGVWAGNMSGEGRPGLTGLGSASPVLFEIFSLLPASGWFEMPHEDLVPVTVCRQSGYLSGPHCQHTDTVLAPKGGSRSPGCPFHQIVHLTADKRYRVNSNCCAADSMEHISWFVLPPVQEWFYVKHNHEYRVLPPFRQGCSDSRIRTMDLIYPANRTTVFLPRGLSGDPGRVVFEAVHSRNQAQIFWHLDKTFLGVTRSIHQMEASPEPGEHRLLLMDDTGEEIVATFRVTDNKVGRHSD